MKNGQFADRLVVDAPNLDATFVLGRRLGKRLFPGAVIGLIGDLGVGKTHLVRAIAEGLEIADSRIVTSPTFVLIQEYSARLPIYHFDAYRLTTVREFADLGAHEYFESDGVCLVEWSDKVASLLPEERLDIAGEVIGPTARRFTCTAWSARYATLLAQLS